MKRHPLAHILLDPANRPTIHWLNGEPVYFVEALRDDPLYGVSAQIMEILKPILGGK